MKTSDAGVKLIKEFESLELSPYHCPAGLPTIGYGHLLSLKPWLPLGEWDDITEEEADALLRKDLSMAENAVGRLISAPLSPGQHAALVSFTFNLGSGALQASTLRRVLNRGEYHEAPDQLRRWVFAKGVRLAGLERRREAEIVLGAPWVSP